MVILTLGEQWPRSTSSSNNNRTSKRSHAMFEAAGISPRRAFRGAKQIMKNCHSKWNKSTRVSYHVRYVA